MVLWGGSLVEQTLFPLSFGWRARVLRGPRESQAVAHPSIRLLLCTALKNTHTNTNQIRVQNRGKGKQCHPLDIPRSNIKFSCLHQIKFILQIGPFYVMNSTSLKRQIETHKILFFLPFNNLFFSSSFATRASLLAFSAANISILALLVSSLWSVSSAPPPAVPMLRVVDTAKLWVEPDLKNTEGQYQGGRIEGAKGAKGPHHWKNEKECFFAFRMEGQGVLRPSSRWDILLFWVGKPLNIDP